MAAPAHRRSVDVDVDRVARRLQRGELAREQRRAACSDGAAARAGRAIVAWSPRRWTKRTSPARASRSRYACLQRGAREHGVAAARRGCAQRVDDAVEPRPAVVVGQRYAGGHFRDVRRRMKIVGIEERPAERLRQRRADRRLAGARHAHHDEDHARCDGMAAEALTHRRSIAALRPSVASCEAPHQCAIRRVRRCRFHRAGATAMRRDA